MAVEDGRNRYEVGALVASSKKFELYLCKQVESGRECLFQIATEVANNGMLDRTAFILEELERKAAELEEEYAKVRTDPKMFINYDLGFPELVDSFVCEEWKTNKSGLLQVNILGFRGIERINQLAPIRNIVVKDHRRIDLRTSAWIMGKSLKILDFAHSLGISVGRIDATNILIEADQHRVVFFDWSDAQLYPKSEIIPSEIRRREISETARAIIFILGGNLETREFPGEIDEQFKPYIEYLWQLADEKQRDAKEAYTQFYKLVDELWERVFYPFTTHSI